MLELFKISLKVFSPLLPSPLLPLDGRVVLFEIVSGVGQADLMEPHCLPKDELELLSLSLSPSECWA